MAVKRIVRRVGMWALWLVLGLVAVLTSYVLVLVFPTPGFSHRAQFVGYRVYSDEAVPVDLGSVIDEAAWRAKAMEPGSNRSGARIYLCNSPRRYAFFAFLTRKNPMSLAIDLSVPNVIFVSMERVEQFRTANAGRLRHTRFEGNLAEVIAHEIAHFHSIEALGYRAHLAQPVWKSEGWAEYQANVAAIRNDPTYDLAERIDQLLDDRCWVRSPGIARHQWEWQLLVEYLAGIEGYGLKDLISDQVTADSAAARMMSWHRRDSIEAGRE
jgi:hypothetical protein